MTIINSKSKFVKEKNKRQGKNLFAGSVLTTHNRQPRGNFPASFSFNLNFAAAAFFFIAAAAILTSRELLSLFFDIKYEMDHKNGSGVILMSLTKGETDPLGKKSRIRSDPIQSDLNPDLNPDPERSDPDFWGVKGLRKSLYLIHRK